MNWYVLDQARRLTEAMLKRNNEPKKKPPASKPSQPSKPTDYKLRRK